MTISEESEKESIVATDLVGKLVKSFSVDSKFGLGGVSTGLEVSGIAYCDLAGRTAKESICFLCFTVTYKEKFLTFGI